MNECEYWWSEEDTEICGLTNSRCACNGLFECCPICSSAVSEAMRHDRRTLDRSGTLRSRRRREWDAAS